jgi:hypothetical protein
MNILYDEQRRGKFFDRPRDRTVTQKGLKYIPRSSLLSINQPTLIYKESIIDCSCCDI